MPVLLSALTKPVPQFICGQPVGRECDMSPGQSLTAVAYSCDVASPTKNPINEVTVDVKYAQSTEEARESNMVAGAPMKVHAVYFQKAE